MNEILKEVSSALNYKNISKSEKLNVLLDTFTDGKSINGVGYVNDKKCHVRFVTVTPQLAKFLLEKFNDSNRPKSRINVSSLVKEMSNNRWKFNGETITFNSNGDLTNGQHRLSALIESDMTIVFIVITDLDSDTFATIDVGRRRTGSDVLSVGGVNSSNQTSAICKFIYGFKNEKFSANRNSNRTLSNTEIFDYYLELNNVTESVNFGMNNSKKSNGLLTATIVGGFHYLLSEVNPEKAEDFMIKLCLGLELKTGSPIIALRNKLIKARTEATYRLTNELLIKNILYCWEKYLKDEKVVKLKLPDSYEIKL